MLVEVVFCIFAAAVAALVWSARRAQELFVLSVRNKRVIVVRGSLPLGLFDALADVVQRAGIERATIRVERNRGAARVTATGLDEYTLQRARNVVGTVPFQRLVSASWPRSRNLGQRLGIAWLAWRLR